MLKLTNQKLPVEIDGEVYQLTKPKNRDAELMMKFSQGTGDQNHFELGMEFLINSGIPEDVVKSLDLNLTSTIIEYLLPEKKD